MNEVIDRAAYAWSVLEGLVDPEIPVLTLLDLGVIRSVDVMANDAVRIALSPTYSGCPATRVIRGSIIDALQDAGFKSVTVEEVLSPAWTSEWITERGRQRLLDYGIAPPPDANSSAGAACPRCGSLNTRKLSDFGSTPCKAHYRCESCLEPFDQFKCI